MHFLLPYIKPTVFAGEAENLHRPPKPIHESASPEEPANFDSDLLVDTEDETFSENVSHVEVLSLRKPKIEPVYNEADESLEDWLKTRNPTEDDAGKMFLWRLLPDIQDLTGDQMSTFRIKVLLLLEDIKNHRVQLPSHC